jgi:hypothetical protein
MGFASGLLAGIATGAEEVISKDLEAGKLETKQLAKLRAERTMQRSDQRDKDVRESFEKTQKLAAQLGPGADIILKNFVEKGGLGYAEEATANLIKVARSYDMSPAEYVGIQLNDSNTAPSLESLRAISQLSVAPIKPIAVPESAAGGYSKLFGIGGKKRIGEVSDSMVQSVGGISKQDLTGLPQGTSLAKLDEAMPILKDTNEQKQDIVRKIQFFSGKLANPNLPPQERQKLEAQLQEENTKAATFGKIAKLISGDTDRDLMSEYATLVDRYGRDDSRSKEMLQTIQILYGAKRAAPTDITGNDVRLVLNDSINLTNRTYDPTKGGMTDVVIGDNGRVTEQFLNPTQVKLKQLDKQIESYKRAINMVTRATNADAHAKSLVNQQGGYRDKLTELLQERDTVQRAITEGPRPAGEGSEGGGAGSLNTNAGATNDANPVNKFMTRLQDRRRSGLRNQLSTEARRVTSIGVDTPAYNTFVQYIASSGRTTIEQAKTIVSRLNAIGGTQ